MLTTAEKMEKMEYLKKGYETHVLTNLYVKGFEYYPEYKELCQNYGVEPSATDQ